MTASNAKKNKLKRLALRDGAICWLCEEKIDLEITENNSIRPTLDHRIPKKYGGKNNIENLKIAHQYCNHFREKLYPYSLIFEVNEIYVFTNPNLETKGLSKKALKYFKEQQR